MSVGEFAGTVAVVTGGAKGIGRVIAEALARAGADLLLIGRDVAALEIAAHELSALGVRVQGLAADLTVPAQVARITPALRADFGSQVDLIVTAAGQRDHDDRALDALDLGHFEQVMQGNVMATLLPIREMLPLMKARRSGKIVAISGVYGLKGRARHMAGCTSKWAIEGMVRVLALELGPFNINVNAVCPGYVDGPRLKAGMEKSASLRGVDTAVVRAEVEQASALGRIACAQDVANATLFLGSERARNITGQDLIVDAGWML